MINTREMAIECLLLIDTDGSYSNITINNILRKYKLNINEKSFISALVYGTLERKITLDYIITKLTDKPLSKIKPYIRCVLQMGVYQILYMDKIPDFAVVNESVNLIKSNKKYNFATGFVNAVLRNVIRNKDAILPADDTVDGLSIKYSTPKWLVEMLINQYDKEITINFLEDSLKPANTYIKVNTLKTDINNLSCSFTNKGIIVEKTDVNNALKISNYGSISELDEYKNGLFHIQDLASQKAIMLFELSENLDILDLCSAPGGKTFTMAEIMNDNSKITACDIHNHRLDLIKSGADRLGIKNINVIKNDATQYNGNLGKFDRVLCDVPCSGLGIIKRKPEIKFKNPFEFDELPEIQYNILSTAVKYLKDDGVLMYSTCTIRKEENENVVLKFVDNNPEYKIISMKTFLPITHNCDGFFACTISR